MSATRKGKIGAIIGLIIMAFIALVLTINDVTMWPIFFIYPIIGAIYGFGFAFGWPLAKRWLAKSFGFAAGVGIFTMLLSRNREQGCMWGFFMFILILSFGVGLAYLPGIYIGIKEIIAEKKVMHI